MINQKGGLWAFDQGEEGTCYAHAITRLICKLFKKIEIIPDMKPDVKKELKDLENSYFKVDSNNIDQQDIIQNIQMNIIDYFEVLNSNEEVVKEQNKSIIENLKKKIDYVGLNQKKINKSNMYSDLLSAYAIKNNELIKQHKIQVILNEQTKYYNEILNAIINETGVNGGSTYMVLSKIFKDKHNNIYKLIKHSNKKIYIQFIGKTKYNTELIQYIKNNYIDKNLYVILNYTPLGSQFGHAVVITEIDDHLNITIKNSWGIEWGNIGKLTNHYTDYTDTVISIVGISIDELPEMGSIDEFTFSYSKRSLSGQK